MDKAMSIATMHEHLMQLLHFLTPAAGSWDRE
jgi:hypothetical protein